MYQECQRGRRRKRDKMESRHSSNNLRESVRGELSVCDLSSPAFWSVKTILCPPPLSFEIDSLYMAQAGLELVTIPLKSPGTEITTAKEHFFQRVFDSIFTQNRFVLESPLLCHLRSMRWSHVTSDSRPSHQHVSKWDARAATGSQQWKMKLCVI